MADILTINEKQEENALPDMPASSIAANVVAISVIVAPSCSMEAKRSLKRYIREGNNLLDVGKLFLQSDSGGSYVCLLIIDPGY